MTEPATAQPAGQAILIIRLSALGDIVMATPLIKALRTRYPDAYLAWLVQPEAEPLLSANPGLDEVIIWPRADWKRLWSRGQWLALAREASALVRRLRGRRFDTVIDIQGLLKSGVWAQLSGAPNRIGLGSREGSALFMTQVIPVPKYDKLIGAEYRHLLRALGMEAEGFALEVAVTAEDRAFARDLIERQGLRQGYAVLCPFTTRPQKHWAQGRWIDLARRLREDLGLPAVILGGPGDAQAAARMTAARPGLFVDITGKTTLRQAAALIVHAALLVGVDTALTHIGTAFRVPTVALFGSTCPYLRTDSQNTVVVYKGLVCSPCKRRPTCGGSFECMGLVTVDEVMSHVRRLLDRG